MIQVTKRDGRKQEFNSKKIVDSLEKCGLDELKSKTIALQVINELATDNNYEIEHIQNVVEKFLRKENKELQKKYHKYRQKRNNARNFKKDMELLNITLNKNEYLKTENSNKNSQLVTTMRDYLAGEVSKDISKRVLLPEDIVKAHENGLIHFHDMDYFIQPMTNCCLINLKDMLDNGTVVNGKMIRSPHRFLTACTIATQIILAVSSSQYGGCTITISHLAPYLRKSKVAIEKKYRDSGLNLSEEQIEKLVETDLKNELRAGVQTFNYQVNSMANSNGQSPFITTFFYLSEDKEYTKEIAMITEEFLKQRLEGIENEQGVRVTQEFPKMIYVLEENNIHKDSEYYWLTELSAKCTAKRFVPDYVSEKVTKELKEGNCFPSMGCRSSLSPWKDENGNYKFYSRFNQGVCTLNLVDVALSSNGDINKFWKILDERAELCHQALLCRHKRLEGTPSDVAPILWQHGAFARLKKGETIDKLLHGGYSTISLGYAGLYECVKYMTNESHSHGKGFDFGIEIMTKLNDYCDKWNSEHNIGFSVYGSPIESTTYKFAKCLKKRFGMIKGITDHDYITNSYHINVREEINPFDKLIIESKFQRLSKGGNISYIEASDLTKNTEAIIEIMKCIYEHNAYAEINIKSDYCAVCGYDGEIKIIETDHGLDWKCPNCGNTDHNKMNIARRTCGRDDIAPR